MIWGYHHFRKHPYVGGSFSTSEKKVAIWPSFQNPPKTHLSPSSTFPLKVVLFCPGKKNIPPLLPINPPRCLNSSKWILSRWLSCFRKKVGRHENLLLDKSKTRNFLGRRWWVRTWGWVFMIGYRNEIHPAAWCLVVPPVSINKSHVILLRPENLWSTFINVGIWPCIVQPNWQKVLDVM